MEKLFLELCTPSQELDIVDHQHVYVAVVITEFCARFLGDGVDKVVQEVFARRIQHLLFGGVGSNMVRNRVHKVGFAQARFPVNKQGVENFARRFSNRFRRRISKLTARARHERIKGDSNLEYSSCRLLYVGSFSKP